MTVVTLQGFTPPTRFDAIPWNRAQIQEAPADVGPWTTLETRALNPLDTDPTVPAPRNITTTLATLTNGWYRVTWLDANGGTSVPTPPVENEAGEQDGWLPTIAEVASRMRSRTKVSGGKELGTFTSATRPTADQVADLISDAADEVLGKVQPIDPTLPPGSAYNAPGSDYERRIRRTIALYATIQIELSYFPEQVKTGQSPVTVYQQLYDGRIHSLISEGETGRAEGMGVGGSGGGSGDSPADAAWAFPVNTGGLVGWQSRW